MDVDSSRSVGVVARSVAGEPRRVHHPAKTVGEHQPVRIIGVAGDPQPTLVM